MLMKKTLLLIFVGLIACSGYKIARAQALSISHPDDPAKKVEYFLAKPKSSAPWPTVVFLHGHQEWPRAGEEIL
jgi:poly(3-hydroxybutyrate) depolymerase